MNKQDIGGVIKSDIILNHTKLNKPVLNVLIQTIDKYKDKDKNIQTRKNMHNVKFWGKTALIVSEKYKKGDYIVVSGHSETKKHEGSYITEMIVSSIEHIQHNNH